MVEAPWWRLRCQPAAQAPARPSISEIEHRRKHKILTPRVVSLSVRVCVSQEHCLQATGTALLTAYTTISRSHHMSRAVVPSTHVYGRPMKTAIAAALIAPKASSGGSHRARPASGGAWRRSSSTWLGVGRGSG